MKKLPLGLGLFAVSAGFGGALVAACSLDELGPALGAEDGSISVPDVVDTGVVEEPDVNAADADAEIDAGDVDLRDGSPDVDAFDGCTPVAACDAVPPGWTRILVGDSNVASGSLTLVQGYNSQAPPGAACSGPGTCASTCAKGTVAAEIGYGATDCKLGTGNFVLDGSCMEIPLTTSAMASLVSVTATSCAATVKPNLAAVTPTLAYAFPEGGCAETACPSVAGMKQCIARPAMSPGCPAATPYTIPVQLFTDIDVNCEATCTATCAGTVTTYASSACADASAPLMPACGSHKVASVRWAGKGDDKCTVSHGVSQVVAKKALDVCCKPQ